MQRPATAAAPMCRSRTDEFVQLRAQCLGRRAGGGRAIPSLSGRATKYEQLQADGDAGRDSDVEAPGGAYRGPKPRDPVVLPEWAEVLDLIRDEQRSIENMLTRLTDMHRKKNMPTGLFNAPDSSDNVDIQILTSQVSAQFKKADHAIQKLEPLLTRCKDDAARSAIKNVQASSVTQLGKLSAKFRGVQRAYLEDEKKRRRAARSSNDTSDDIRRWEEEDMEARARDAAQLQNLSEEQAQSMRLQNELINERDQELQDILKSLVEINDMFQHLNTMVIDQGTMLDRIDYNVQTAHEHVTRGVKELHETHKKAKKNQFKYIVCFLLMMITLVAITMMVKKA